MNYQPTLSKDNINYKTYHKFYNQQPSNTYFLHLTEHISYQDFQLLEHKRELVFETYKKIKEICYYFYYPLFMKYHGM